MAATEDEIPTTTIPTDYRAGYEKARQLAPETAANYVAHTLIGDPLADAMMEDLASVSMQEQALLFQAALLERDWDYLAHAPSSAREFFEDTEKVPDWVDFDSFIPGIRMFHRNSHLILGAFVGGTLVEGFATNISKAFFISGRVRDQGVRRLRQNNRHMIEIFMPSGPDQGRGWLEAVGADPAGPRPAQTVAHELRRMGPRGVGPAHKLGPSGLRHHVVLGQAPGPHEEPGG